MMNIDPKGRPPGSEAVRDFLEFLRRHGVSVNPDSQKHRQVTSQRLGTPLRSVPVQSRGQLIGAQLCLRNGDIEEFLLYPCGWRGEPIPKTNKGIRKIEKRLAEKFGIPLK